MNEELVRELLEKRETYRDSARETTGSAAALALLQRSLLKTLENYDLTESTEALVGATVAVDHVLRCLAVANRVASEVSTAGEEELAAALQTVARGCLAADAVVLMELLEYRL